MGKKLAIRGHSTRGKEVIEILEMMGGKNCYNLNGLFSENAYYFIGGPHNDEILGGEYMFGNEGIYWFTLEEFLNKYPFKVGDKVYTKSNAEGTIIDIFWDGIEVLYQLSSANVNALGYFYRNELKSYKEEVNMKDKEDKLFDSIIWHLRNSVNNGKQNLSGGECEDYFREVVKKNNENKMKNVIVELLEHIKTTPKEELEREFKEIESEGWTNVGPTVEEFMDFCNKVNKKPEYPKTYEECCKALNLTKYPPALVPNKSMFISQYKDFPHYYEIQKLAELLICRDAYWKIAGKEMGLDKPWEPDWNDEIQKYCIRTDRNKIVNCSSSFNNRILAFPTEEMRDVFYENFNKEIEQCKELL